MFYRAAIDSFPPLSPRGEPITQSQDSHEPRFRPAGAGLVRVGKETSTMETNLNSQTEVLHNEHHSRLTAEEIAKAVARHNREHSEAPVAAEKTKKGKKN